MVAQVEGLVQGGGGAAGGGGAGVVGLGFWWTGGTVYVLQYARVL
jgi:hypothetical protein